MKVLHFIYNDQAVEFIPSQNNNVMVNATQMAKLFGKEVKHFNENESTKIFIETCLKSRNSDFLGIKKREDLIDSRQKSGTWMHRVLALKFAAWLDPAFELWVFCTIDQILMGHYNDHKQATIQKLLAKKELERKRQQLLDANPEVFSEFLEIEERLNSLDKKRNLALKSAVKQLELDFYKAEMN